MTDMEGQRFFESPQPIIIPEDTPLVFLEGPVQGAPDWQTPLAHRLLERIPNLAVASPRATKIQENNFRSSDEEISELASEQQVAYEFTARVRAYQYGVVAMWWAAQDPSIPYPEERVYGKTSNAETGEPWGWMFSQGPGGHVVGFDPNYKASSRNSKNYIHRNNRWFRINEQYSLEDFEEAIVQEITNVGRRPIDPLISQSAQQALDQLR